MSDRSTDHETFEIVRTYEAAPAAVFGAWAEPEAKASWFGPAGAARTLEFEVGGREHFVAAGPDGASYTYDALYYDIVADERIVYAYEMHRDGTRISVSLSTVAFEADGAQTRLTYTEQCAFLDGHDTVVAREHGTGEMLNALAARLRDGIAAG
ncbi:MAG TPA: SRPBCC domain-containing protein [Solirubrobacteraceae bacterium]|jgi:uncharacterized protein YndB with AHSA1/START domain